MTWLRNNWILVLSGVVVLGVLVFAARQHGGLSNISAVIVKTPLPSESPSDINNVADAIKKAESAKPPGIGDSPTDAEIYSNPYIRHIRIALSGYLDGTNNGINDPEYVINGSSDMPNCGLKKFDKAYYKSKFIVLTARDNDYGGVQADIVFINKPDTIFWAWVYQLASGKYDLRGFCPDGPAEDKKAEFTNYINETIKNLKFSL